MQRPGVAFLVMIGMAVPQVTVQLAPPSQMYVHAPSHLMVQFAFAPSHSTASGRSPAGTVRLQVEPRLHSAEPPVCTVTVQVWPALQVNRQARPLQLPVQVIPVQTGTLPAAAASERLLPPPPGGASARRPPASARLPAEPADPPAPLDPPALPPVPLVDG
jgi:hypothetical protein